MYLNATILGQVIAFILFVWFCMKYVWNPLMSVIEERQKKIIDSLESIKTSKMESERIRNEALACLKQAHIKSEEIIKYAYECKMQILHTAQNEAYQERDKILSQTQIQIDQERERIISELRNHVSKLVIESTEKVIDTSINKIIDYDFVDKIIKQLSNYED
ncbi:ATP synthase subunit B [Candidatus Blochmanniella floridana]|uniref:ATP synthase subunit b n=1 Tax=Blochmanniella floridana TaxID=203907 RepID=ATPF_BLOFL|nr:RecName: Full=ATP synthase subunit b; AltName: Full=ATP synthase F(0) sector subunit b; AltName: Full=ATPase subunit I; AltName: Full=F-type ATPase subunit b; Short=F-ATPase subunit b [Candidatus Blochmannia floridanus]CAD83532.1 ATP synthase subunit B [Candidatus Blochmannia floridanus]